MPPMLVLAGLVGLTILGAPGAPLETQDGLSLQLDPPHPQLTVNGTVLGEGAVIRATDVRTGESEEIPLSPAEEVLFPALGLSLDTEWIAAPDHLRFDGTLTNLRASEESERAVTLTLALKVRPDLAGLTWDDDIRVSRAVVSGEVYQNTMPSFAGKEGYVARYPFACVRGEGWGLALANPIAEPRIMRLACDATRGELAISWDLGLWSETEHFPDQAGVSALIFAADPAWGFRDAARRYMALQPGSFTVRAARQGIWMPFTQIDHVERPEDFEFGFHEYHTDVSIAWDEAHGVASLIYTEPVVHWLNMPSGVPRTYEGFLQTLMGLYTPKAFSIISSGCFEPDQTFTHSFHVFPWADGARIPTDPDPEVPVTDRAPTNRFDEDWGTITDALGWARGEQSMCNGAYFDSFEGWDMDRLNYRRDHWRVVDWPLTFDAQGRLAHPDMFHAYEFAAEVGRRLHAAGKLTMANTSPYRFCWTTAWLDVLGIETNWGVGEELAPPPRTELDWVRTLCGAKPYCYLQNVPFEQFRGDKVKGYFERCLFYGFFPSFFSHDAANDPYWENAALYNEDRPLFLRYLPAIRRIAEAGWRPVTGARADNPDVLIERFGEGDGFYLTLFNSGTQDAAAHVTLDPALIAQPWEWVAYDLLSLEMPERVSGGGFVLRAALPPGGVAVWRVQRTMPAALADAVGALRPVADELRRRVADPSRAGHEAEYAESVSRAEGELALVKGLGREQQAGVTLQLEGPSVVSPGGTVNVTLRIAGPRGARGRPLGSFSLLRAGLEIERAPFGPSYFAGGDLGGMLAIPSSLEAGETLTLAAHLREPCESVRFMTLHVERPLQFTRLPRRLVFRDGGILQVFVTNNTGDEQDATVTFTPPPGFTADPPSWELTTYPRGPAQVRTDLHPVEDFSREVRGDLRLSLVSALGTDEATIPIIRTGRDASLARGDRVEVTVDSTFPGYTAAPLNDGVTDTAGVFWSDAAWASGETNSAHWILIRFPGITRIHEIKVWWALDGGTLWSAAEDVVEIRTPDGQWHEVGHTRNPAPRPCDTYSFDPTDVTALRVTQPSGQGAPARPFLMWVSEVEAR